MHPFVALALAAASSAAATAIPAAAAAAAPQQPSAGQFYTSMTIGNGNEITINAVRNGTDGDILLVGERPSVFSGTPTFAQHNPKDSGESLSFDFAGGHYGWKVHDVGHVHGAVFPVTAVKDYAEFKFHGGSAAGSGEITHVLTSTENKFLACERIVNGATATVLSWGNNGYPYGLPEGCKATTVRKSPTTKK